ncbi:MucR family transcriptional regulator [Lichenibacterium minor]|jgi:predicted transcriptional regulator|uniref:MucR family transcriptional regulator n=1 Tax=Lichenibacterium minor TaxID=2316528 RepID=A0A4Q2U4V0_9HYPH|nr:MucR family transcriptional regulator [Lichenibacterium minor]RYC31422.1 MucR family transcriptional regulator [Lichenibacterium minor]
MSDLDPTALAEMTAEVVAAYVTRNHVQASDVPNLISTVHDALARLAHAPEAAPEPAKLVPPVSIKKSLTDDYLVSLEDGRHYQSLKRHLAGRGLTPDEYRTKWGLPPDYPMVAPVYARKRSELAKSIGLGSMRKTG